MFIEIEGGAVEVDGRSSLFAGIQHGEIQSSTMHRPDHFTVIQPIALQLRRLPGHMHHAAAHHDRLGHHFAFEPGLAQRVKSTFGQGKIDRAAFFVAGLTGVAPMLVQRYLEASTAQ